MNWELAGISQFSLSVADNPDLPSKSTYLSADDLQIDVWDQLSIDTVYQWFLEDDIQEILRDFGDNEVLDGKQLNINKIFNF